MKKVDENKAMVVSQTKEVKHHADELSKVLGKHKNIESWVVGKIERASTDLSDVTHYLDGKKYAEGGGVGEAVKFIRKQDFLSKKREDKIKWFDKLPLSEKQELFYSYKRKKISLDQFLKDNDKVAIWNKVHNGSYTQYAKGGGVESKEWQIKNNDKYFSIGMDGKFKWNESPDMGYTYTYDEVQELSNIIKEQYPNIEIVKYNKDWWKTNKYANGGEVEKVDLFA
jgi:hypothetical protein